MNIRMKPKVYRRGGFVIYSEPWTYRLYKRFIFWKMARN